MNRTQRFHIMFLSRDTQFEPAWLDTVKPLKQSLHALSVSNPDDVNAHMTGQKWDFLIIDMTCFDPMNFVDQTYWINEINKSHSHLCIIAVMKSFDDEQELMLIQAGALYCLKSGQEEKTKAIWKQACWAQSQTQALSESQAAHLLLSEANQLILEQIDRPMAFLLAGEHIQANKPYLNYMGLKHLDEISKFSFKTFITPEDHQKFDLFYHQYATSPTPQKTFNTQVCTLDGVVTPATIVFQKSNFEGEACTQVTLDDQENAHRYGLAKNDVTGLHDRHFLMSELRQRKKDTRHQGWLLMIHFEDYERLRSSYGWSESLLILNQFASLLRDQIPESMILTHVDDQHFACLIDQPNKPETEALINKLQKGFQATTIELANESFFARFKIAAVPMPQEKSYEPEGLLSRGFQVLHDLSKTNTQTAYAFYEASETITSKYDRGDIQRAMDENQFKVLFQPIIDLSQKTDPNYEIFLGVENKQGQIQPPIEYLKSAENVNLSSKIDRWVILQAIKLARSKQSAGEKLHLTINLSAATLLEHAFFQWLKLALESAKVAPGTFTFQVPTSVCKEHTREVRQLIHTLSKVEAKLAISHVWPDPRVNHLLHLLKPDLIKIDYRVMSKIHQTEAQSQMKALHEQAEQVGFQVLAPFIEQASTLASLWQVHDGLVQGYYIQPPSTTLDFDFSGAQVELF